MVTGMLAQPSVCRAGSKPYSATFRGACELHMLQPSISKTGGIPYSMTSREACELQKY
jgi:hypothetical protein